MNALAPALVLFSAFAAADPAATARALVVSYAEGDLAALKGAWVGGAPPPAFLQRLQATQRVKCLTLRQARVTSEAPGPEVTDVALEVVLESVDRAGGPARFEVEHPRIHLVRDGTSWKVAGWTLREDELARRIAEGGETGIDDRDLLGPTLARAVRAQAVQLVNQHKLAEAGRVGQVMDEAANKTGDPTSLSYAAGVGCILLRMRNEPDRSLERCRSAVTSAEQTGDADVLGRALLNLARIVQVRAHVGAAARDLFDRVVALEPRLEDTTILARAAEQLGEIALERGDFRTALRYITLVARIGVVTGDPFSIASPEMALGRLYANQGDFELSVEHFRRAVAASRAAGHLLGEASSLTGLAASYQRLGNRAAFLITIEEARRVATKVQEADTLAEILVDIAADALEHGDFARAERTLEEAKTVGRKSVERLTPESVLEMEALLRLRQKRYAEAIAAADQAIALEVTNDAPTRFDAWIIAAKASRALGDLPAAEARLREIIALTEATREGLYGSQRQQRTFFASRAAAYVELVQVLIARNRNAEALAVAERAKGRTLLDILREGGNDNSAAAPADREREQQLVTAIAGLNRRLFAARLNGRPPAEMAQIGAELARTRLELESFRSFLYSRNPRLATRRGPAGGNAKPTLPAGVTAIEYVVADERLYAFTVTRRGEHIHVDVKAIPVGRKRLERTIAAFSSQLAHRNLTYRAAAAALGRLLLPAALDGVVCIVPDGPLWRLPFEALIGGDGRFAAERAAFFYAPSLAVLAEMTGRTHGEAPAAHAFLAFANPRLQEYTTTRARSLQRDISLGPLPESETEVRQVARLYGASRSRLYIGPGASEARVKREAASYRVVHFATHGVLDDQNPMYSYLVLARDGGDDAEDGLLEAWEMMNLDLEADLTVLSACSTAGGTVNPGEGLIGMTWAIFAAGCPSTIASQWTVSSASTASLMEVFYREWLRLGTTTPFAKAKAMQRARLHLLRDPRRRHPYYWSAFVLLGAP